MKAWSFTRLKTYFKEPNVRFVEVTEARVAKKFAPGIPLGDSGWRQLADTGATVTVCRRELLEAAA